METADLVELFRKQVSDEAEPHLWDDDEVFQYLVDAQDTYVRLTGGIRDGSTRALTDVRVVANKAFSDHSPYILRIRSARLLDAERDLKIINEADVGLQRFSDYGLAHSLSALDDEDTGDVRAMILGVTKGKIRWLKVPTESDTCRMHVMRLPYPRIEDEGDCLEIDEQHHIHLLKWMKHLAYSKEDAETYDRDLADKNEVAFKQYCRDAKTEEEGQRFKPRVVHYGGL